MRKQLVFGFLGIALLLGSQPAGAAPDAPAPMTSSEMKVLFQQHVSRAEAGDADAQYSVAMDYFVGLGVEKDPSIAVRWFTRAAEQKHAGAMRALGELYLDGESVKRDAALGIRWLEQAAAVGDAEALYTLSGIYVEGVDAAKDLERGLGFLRQAATGGHPDACFVLGTRYLSGTGLERRSDEGLKWLVKAADAKHDQAITMLASIAMEAAHQESGLDAQMLAQAMKWYDEAADLGNVAAQGQLALAHFYGVGAAKDPVAAATWAALAKRGPALRRADVEGRHVIGSRLDEIEASLTPVQRQEVDRRVAAWISAHPRVMRVNSVLLPDGKLLTTIVGGKENPLPQGKSTTPRPKAQPKAR